jgi:hypothetical protein
MQARFDQASRSLPLLPIVHMAGFVCLIAAPLPAHAHTFCIVGGDAGQLQDALASASDGGMYDSEDNIVRIAQGTIQDRSRNVERSILLLFDFHLRDTNLRRLQSGLQYPQ